MLLINGQIYNNDFQLENKDIRIDSGKITAIAEPGTLEQAQDEEVIDLTGKMIAPGLIDIHTHGANGRDTMDGDPESLEIISRHLASNGVTSFLPTTMTMGADDLNKTFDNVPESTSGSQILGFHMEGPYINVQKKGAQNAEHVRVASVEEINSYLEKVNISIIDIAPEIEGNLDFIETMSDKINIQVGHCMAAYEDTIAARERGAVGLCHTFNAMPAIHHRKPGPIPAAAATDMYAEIIADGMHLNPAIVVLAHKLFGAKRMNLVSDAIKTTGQVDGEYVFGGQPVIMKDGITTMKDSGAIAGGTSNLWQEVKNCISWGIPTADAFRMASLTPAEYIKVDDKKGSIVEGKDADFVITNENLDILDVYILGEKFQ